MSLVLDIFDLIIAGDKCETSHQVWQKTDISTYELSRSKVEM
jgi:hypothetical protein